MNGFADFRILVDDPADDPTLGFPEYADAFAEIVCGSPPRFAVGIFGSWGSGKTTLMQAILTRIEGRKDVIPVWFNAWRYEREQQLIIPLLDVLREALLEWAEDDDKQGEKQAASTTTIAGRARRAAAAMGAAARAIAMGVSVSARLPGGVAEATLDLERILSNHAADDRRAESVSLYHASFRTMADAVREFVTAGGQQPRGGPRPDPQRRIVVFVDDLDRCLPLNALAVLESMKLFFDLEGFVFVAGLDQQVIERAIELRYADPRERAHAEPDPTANEAAGKLADGHHLGPAAGGISGRDYVKKIFQVPFGLPSVDRSQLEELVPRLVAAHRLPQAQESDLRGRILAHLQYFSDEGGINPREVKRLINAYTLQAKLMSLKLRKVDRDAAVDRDTILALQVMAFRPDWERIWLRLEADPDGFVARLKAGLERTRDADTVWVDGEPLPPRLVDYLSTGPAGPLLTNAKLKAYLSSSRASHTSEREILGAQAAADALRRLILGVDEATDRARLSAALHEKLDPLKSSLSQLTWGRELMPLLSRLESDASALVGSEPQGPAVPIGEWSAGFRARLDRLDNDLRDLRDRHSLRAT